MKYNVTVKSYRLDLTKPFESTKISVVHKYVWTMKDFVEFVESNNLVMSFAHCYFHPLHKIPFHDYNIGFVKKIDRNSGIVYSATIRRESDRGTIDFNWREFENKLARTNFFRDYKIKRDKRNKEVITHTIVGI